MKKILMILLAMIFAVSLAACGDEEPAPEPKDISTDTGAITATELGIEDYITSSISGDEIILMAKDGEGFGAGEYVLIDGANKDSDDSTWEMRLPSYKFGKEYTLKMMKKDLDEKETYRTVEKTTIGDTEYLYVDYDSSIYYYTVANNHPILIQVIGDSMVDNEAVMAALESIRYNY